MFILSVVQDSQREASDSSESDSSRSQSPNVQDWLAQARSTRSLQQQDSLQRQKVLFLLYLFLSFSLTPNI